jgi:two-component system cell cycle sensor histidine kinase/response regulator CckA
MSVQPCNCRNESPDRITILLVEDEPFVREATCRILEGAGFKVLPVEDAQEAMEVYEHRGRAVDLLITDMVLPGKNGDELGREVRTLSPQIVVLMTSGYGLPAYEIELPETRTYFLAKPYSRRALIEKIEAILFDSKTRRAQAG